MDNSLKIQPRIQLLSAKKLIGKRLEMSFAEYRIGELWQSFMPRRKEITNKVTNELISMSVYGPTHFSEFKQTNKFEKWATI